MKKAFTIFLILNLLLCTFTSAPIDPRQASHIPSAVKQRDSVYIAAHPETGTLSNTVTLNAPTANEASTNIQIATLNASTPTVYENYITDRYMNVTFRVTDLNNGQFHFSVDALWLTMPIYRGWDSIGASSALIHVDDNSCSGWYSYDCPQFSLSDGFTTVRKEVQITNENFENTTNGGVWNGSMGKFKLPGNPFCSNLQAHYEFIGTLFYPSRKTFFNATATYNHGIFSVGFNRPTHLLGRNLWSFLWLNIFERNEARLVELPTSITYNP